MGGSGSPSIAIVGGGAAGIYAALAASRNGARPVLFERNSRIGIKILISGGGKCNITHEASPGELEEGFIRAEGRFLRYAFHELTPADVIAELNGAGLETYTRPNGRVFPVSGRADDVLSAFEKLLMDAGTEIRTRALVAGINVSEGTASGIRADGQDLNFDRVIVTTGGMSYKKVGTTGDGISWAREMGHNLVPVRAALAPVYFPSPPPSDWQGVALRNVRLWVEGSGDAALRKQGIPLSWEDDLLLTHRGISGPCALEISRAARLLKEKSSTVEIYVDVIPESSAEELFLRLQERTRNSPRSEIQTFIESFVPKALVHFVLDAAKTEAGKKLGELTREERSSILKTLKRLNIGRVGEVPIDRGEVTAGGVALDEVSGQTMESKRVRGLYFAGEILDIAGSVGGYNLQAAFSTGFIAGRAAATSIA